MINSFDFEKIKNISFGATYSSLKTTFSLLALDSDFVVLNIETSTGFIERPMSYQGNNVFSLTLEGNWKNHKYFYTISRDGKEIKTNDPFAKETSLSSQYSVVVDTSFLFKKHRPIKKKQTNTIIYELNIKDFTIDESSSSKEKGKYLSFFDGKRTKKGHPYGISYLKYLGITHVQLLPVMDFYSQDDSLSFYNWGYDPLSYFALEGGYSSHPEKPTYRMKEFQKMVRLFHKNGIKVVLDVVYNHVYQVENSTFEKTFPSFYFRKMKNDTFANGSGCGNEIKSEEPFVRKMIIDSLCYYVDAFDIDGFRFDLMGLLDLTTMKEIEKVLRKKKPDILLYGEGWVMGEVLSKEKCANMEMAKEIPSIGFFNDFFRNIIRGDNYDSSQLGFAGGDSNYIHGFEQAFFASSLTLSYDAKFTNPMQSINYCECHDNKTLYDQFDFHNKYDKDTILSMIKLSNALTVLSFGVPFIHMGQEIGLSKNGLDNSYNIKDVNNMRWDLVDERWAMVKYLHDLIVVRKSISDYERKDIQNIYQSFIVNKDENNVLFFDSKNNSFPYSFLINGNPFLCTYSLDDFYTVKLASVGELNRNPFKVKNMILSPFSFYILKKE